MKLRYGPALLLVLAFSLGLFAQSDTSGIKQDGKDAAHSTGKAAKKTGKKVAHGAKRTVHKGSHATSKGAKKVENKTRPSPAPHPE